MADININVSVDPGLTQANIESRIRQRLEKRNDEELKRFKEETKEALRSRDPSGGNTASSLTEVQASEARKKRRKALERKKQKPAAYISPPEEEKGIYEGLAYSPFVFLWRFGYTIGPSAVAVDLRDNDPGPWRQITVRPASPGIPGTTAHAVCTVFMREYDNVVNHWVCCDGGSGVSSIWTRHDFSLAADSVETNFEISGVSGYGFSLAIPGYSGFQYRVRGSLSEINVDYGNNTVPFTYFVLPLNAQSCIAVEISYNTAWAWKASLDDGATGGYFYSVNVTEEEALSGERPFSSSPGIIFEELEPSPGDLYSAKYSLRIQSRDRLHPNAPLYFAPFWTYVDSGNTIQPGYVLYEYDGGSYTYMAYTYYREFLAGDYDYDANFISLTQKDELNIQCILMTNNSATEIPCPEEFESLIRNNLLNHTSTIREDSLFSQTVEEQIISRIDQDVNSSKFFNPDYFVSGNLVTNTTSIAEPDLIESARKGKYYTPEIYWKLNQLINFASEEELSLAYSLPAKPRPDVTRGNFAVAYDKYKQDSSEYNFWYDAYHAGSSLDFGVALNPIPAQLQLSSQYASIGYISIPDSLIPEFKGSYSINDTSSNEGLLATTLGEDDYCITMARKLGFSAGVTGPTSEERAQ